MKKLLILSILLFQVFGINAQYEKVIISYADTTPYWLVQCADSSDTECQLTIYYKGGQVKGKGIINYNLRDKNKRFLLTGDAVLYYPNQSISAKYDYKKGIVLDYYPSGKLASKIISSVDKDVQEEYFYYENGQLWEERTVQKFPNRQNVKMGFTQPPRQDLIAVMKGGAILTEKTYHPNGQLKTNTFRDKRHQSTLIYEFFTPEGKLDKVANYDGHLKNGIRYKYFPNDQLEEIAHYKEDKYNGLLQRWAENGTRVFRAIMKDDDYEWKVEEWWDNGTKKTLSYHENGKKSGPIIEWFHNGKVLTQGSYYDGKVIGLLTKWDTLGSIRYDAYGSLRKQNNSTYDEPRRVYDYTYWLEGKGGFKNGMRDGPWEFYYVAKGRKKEPVSQLCATQTYKDGVLNGLATVYYPNGTIMVEAFYLNGLLEGEYKERMDKDFPWEEGFFRGHTKEGDWKSYHYGTGKVRELRHFKNGISQETDKEWNQDGSLKKERIDYPDREEVEVFHYNTDGSYRKYIVPYGWKYGNGYTYDAQNNLISTTIYKNKKLKDYATTKYYPNGKKMSEDTYTNRKRSGKYLTWYEDGKPKLEIPFENGLKHGTAYFWDETGKKTTKVYENGGLVDDGF